MVNEAARTVCVKRLWKVLIAAGGGNVTWFCLYYEKETK